MAQTPLVTSLVLVLQDIDLRALTLLNDLCRNRNLLQVGCLGLNIGAIDEQNRGESYGRAWLTLDLLDLDEVTFSNLVLLPPVLTIAYIEGYPLSKLARKQPGRPHSEWTLTYCV